MNFIEERDRDVKDIINLSHPKIIVVAGPGTGKTRLFKKIINKKKENGKTKFLAITFMGKLRDSLADDLAGLADTKTLHGFARELVLKRLPKWDYYPDMKHLIEEDLILKGISNYSIGDENYIKRTKHYRAIGDDDVIYYAVKIYEKNKESIPKYDLILIDEFQDFSEIEAKFIDLIASRNDVLIVGDDDQVLYEFRGSSPRFIREKYHSTNNEFEKRSLRFCSRCTSVLIKAFHSVIKQFQLDLATTKRIKKDYLYFPPDKDTDSKLNEKIVILEQTEKAMIPFKIRDELTNLLSEQAIKNVLIVGEAQTCQSLLKSIARKLRVFGFKNVNHEKSEDTSFYFKQTIVEGYKILARSNKLLAWRVIMRDVQKKDEWKKYIEKYYDDSNGFLSSLPAKFKKLHENNANVLKKLLYLPPSRTRQIAETSINRLIENIVLEREEDRGLLISQLVDENKILPQPLAGLDITVCSILGSKGLGADIVFLVGFDQGKLPSKGQIEKSEIYQMLVVLTRAKKRLYFINTKNCQISSFVKNIDKNCLERSS